LAAIALAAAALRTSGRPLAAVIITFDVLACLVLSIVFEHFGYWACLTCSGPAM
jgi:hypothetical protein